MSLSKLGVSFMIDVYGMSGQGYLTLPIINFDNNQYSIIFINSELYNNRNSVDSQHNIIKHSSESPDLYYWIENSMRNVMDNIYPVFNFEELSYYQNGMVVKNYINVPLYDTREGVFGGFDIDFYSFETKLLFESSPYPFGDGYILSYCYEDFIFIVFYMYIGNSNYHISTFKLDFKKTHSECCLQLLCNPDTYFNYKG